MKGFDEREKAFEKKFVMDEEQTFKITARRNKIFGLWAAEKLSITGDAADAYAKEVVMSDFESKGDDDIITKVLKDLVTAGIRAGEPELRRMLAECEAGAREQLISA